ncbi:hypothetical protein M011DRAFT_463323 [Sporormia fimetaria CBS 119925]|uniref:Uncharacterized protein n=1 Tax=Sporormia fimetaria CBS 119925 TaxID=1340428 RepID=A0A6A6VMK7_9PLEO|nr:hypothetical protein M011DRAFT_463323 [Sporormia fimetaria CBS 119925]
MLVRRLLLAPAGCTSADLKLLAGLSDTPQTPQRPASVAALQPDELALVLSRFKADSCPQPYTKAVLLEMPFAH